MRTYSKKSKLVVAGVTAGTLAVSGVAYAYWTTSGSGIGTAATSAGQRDNLTFSTTTTDGTLLPTPHLVTGIAPGVTSAFQSTVKNTSDESGYVATVKAYLTVAPAVAGAACDATDYKIGKDGAAANLTVGQVIGATDTPAMIAGKAVTLTWTPADLAKNETGVVSGVLAFNDKSTNQDACKGATVTLNYLAS